MTGRDSETLGYGERKGNEIKFVFKAPDGSVEEQFIWEADSKVWHLVSWANTPDGKRIPSSCRRRVADAGFLSWRKSRCHSLARSERKGLFRTVDANRGRF
jgi:hypothetical protein